MKKIITGVFLATSLAFSTQAESDDSDDLRFHKAAMYIMEFCDGEIYCFAQMFIRRFFKQRQPGMQYKPNKEYEKYNLRRYSKLDYRAYEITKARNMAKNTKEYKECAPIIDEIVEWVRRARYGEKYLPLEIIKSQNEKLKSSHSSHRQQEIQQQILEIIYELEETFLKKLKAYEATKEYEVWRVLEEQSLKSAQKALESTKEWKNYIQATKQAHSTKQYQAMIKAQDAVRATQAFKETKKEAEEVGIYTCRDKHCYFYPIYRKNVRNSKAFKEWQEAYSRYKTTDEYKAVQAQAEKLYKTKENRAMIFIQDAIIDGRDDTTKFMQYNLYSNVSLYYNCPNCSPTFDYIIPKDWEDDLWYGSEEAEPFNYSSNHYWEY